MSRRDPPTQYGRLTLSKVEELADKASEIGRWTMWSVYRLARTRSRRQSLKMASRLRYRAAADRIFAAFADDVRGAG